MLEETDLRDAFLASLDHARLVLQKLRANSGRGRVLSFADAHKLSEGLFLSAWTDWEEFTRRVLVTDLAKSPRGALRKDVQGFRHGLSSGRLAELLLTHPDHPTRWIEWDYDKVRGRADLYLEANHRFAVALPRSGDLVIMKRIRNAIAHESPKARESFRSLVKAPPFQLQPSQLRWLSVGRFLFSHLWDTQFVLEECFDVHETHVRHLVP
jgi:hypothetical protein